MDAHAQGVSRGLLCVVELSKSHGAMCVFPQGSFSQCNVTGSGKYSWPDGRYISFLMDG
jgi:putative hemolysin